VARPLLHEPGQAAFGVVRPQGLQGLLHPGQGDDEVPAAVEVEKGHPAVGLPPGGGRGLVEGQDPGVLHHLPLGELHGEARADEGEDPSRPEALGKEEVGHEGPQAPPGEEEGKAEAPLGLLRYPPGLLLKPQGHPVDFLHVPGALGGGGRALPFPVPGGVKGEEEEPPLRVAGEEGEDVLL